MDNVDRLSVNVLMYELVNGDSECNALLRISGELTGEEFPRIVRD